MGDVSHNLHVVLFPYFLQSHMMPVLDIARLFTARNVRTTIITTRVNAPIFTRAIDVGDIIANNLIKLELFNFPSKEAGLPEGLENAELAVKQQGLVAKFFEATKLFEEQLEQFLDRVQPDCLVADVFFPWATKCAAKFNVPRIVFHGVGYFALCVKEIILLHEPYKNVSSDDEPFALPLIPHDVKMVRSQLSIKNEKDDLSEKRVEMIKKSEVESFGVIVNSFYDLESDYVEFYKRELGRKAWHIGPVSLCNRSIGEKGRRGKESSINEHECLSWLETKKCASVVYVCFGSALQTIAPQLHEIAIALENNRKNFIWVVRKDDDGENEEWLPEGFEERTKGRGLIIRGWAPQVLILDHEAIGAFVTHCGWNSTLEGISAGVPMVTWPIFADQFYNEKLITNILKTGVSVGVKKWGRKPSVDDIIKQEAIEKALSEIMDGEKADEMRHKANELKKLAWKAVAEGGSSYNDLSALIDELKGFSRNTL